MINRVTELKNEISETLLPTNLFNEELKHHVSLVHKTVKEGKIEEFAQRLIVTSLEDAGKKSMRIIGLAGFPESNEEKCKVMSMLGLACAANDLRVVMAVFESEAWSAEETRDPATIPTKEFVPPSKRPDRREVIVVAARSIDGRDAIAIIPITGRNEDKSLILGKEKIQESADGSGVKDSLLETFFIALAAGTMAKIQAEFLISQGQEVPKAVQDMILMLDACPIKL
jgi:hypothetical protein